MTNDPDQHQQRQTDGKFGHSIHAPADVELDEDGSDDAIFDEATTTSDDGRLDQLVAHSDREVRLAAVVNPNLTGEHIERLASDEDWVVRMQVADLDYGGVENLLADDDDPVVRHTVLERHGDRLSFQDRDRLTKDPACRQVASELANW